MPIYPNGAQRASRRSTSLLGTLALATLFAFGGLATQPSEAQAAGIKVVIVVGPTGYKTGEYINEAKKIAAQARSYGGRVYEIYSPYATWARVKYYAQGANLFVYLGHGNGWPSPYYPFQTMTKDGLGLNPYSGSGNYTHRYYGEYYLGAYLHLAPNAVVLLKRLCYASGNSEPGRATPTPSVARQRVDNYAAGFLRAGARAVFAEGWRDTNYLMYGLFRTNRTMSQIFWSTPEAVRTYAISFASSRTANKSGWLDPYWYGAYYRSIIGDLSMSAATWR